TPRLASLGVDCLDAAVPVGPMLHAGFVEGFARLCPHGLAAPAIGHKHDARDVGSLHVNPAVFDPQVTNLRPLSCVKVARAQRPLMLSCVSSRARTITQPTAPS